VRPRWCILVWGRMGRWLVIIVVVVIGVVVVVMAFVL
jgi:hypothetical protein